MKTDRLSILEWLALFAYRCVFYLATPFLLWRLYRRSQTQPEYFQRKRERWGWVAQPDWDNKTDDRTIIWVHAVSVGETLAAKPLILRLLDNPKHRLVITCSTPTGSSQIQRLFAEALANKHAFHCYAPYDSTRSVQRFLRQVQPDTHIVLETELWPNSLRLCAQRGVTSYLVNGRLSEKSATAYGKVSLLTRPMLHCLARVLVQTEREGQRFEQLGLPANRWQATGSIKLDVCLADEQREQVNRWRSKWQLQDKPVLIAASTHPTEETLILDAWVKLKVAFPEAVLLLAPRHIDRIDEVEREVSAICSDQRRARRSRLDATVKPAPDVILVDTLGELSNLFGLASVAIMGGTFAERGGHNFVEPALWKIPTVSGFSDFNFADMSQQLQHCGFLKAVEASPEAIVGAVSHWWQAEESRLSDGRAGEAWVAKNRGALQQVIQALDSL